MSASYPCPPAIVKPSRETVKADLDWLYDFAYSDLIGNRETSLEHDGLLRVYMNYRALYLATEKV